MLSNAAITLTRRATITSRRTLARVAPLFLAGLTASCGSIGSYCQDAAECEGGSDADLDACEIVYTQLDERSTLRECDTEFDQYLECLSDTSTCEDDVYVADASCPDLQENLQECLNQ